MKELIGAALASVPFFVTMGLSVYYQKWAYPVAVVVLFAILAVFYWLINRDECSPPA